MGRRSRQLTTEGAIWPIDELCNISPMCNRIAHPPRLIQGEPKNTPPDDEKPKKKTPGGVFFFRFFRTRPYF